VCKDSKRDLFPTQGSSTPPPHPAAMGARALHALQYATACRAVLRHPPLFGLPFAPVPEDTPHHCLVMELLSFSMSTSVCSRALRPPDDRLCSVFVSGCLQSCFLFGLESPASKVYSWASRTCIEILDVYVWLACWAFCMLMVHTVSVFPRAWDKAWSGRGQLTP